MFKTHGFKKQILLSYLYLVDMWLAIIGQQLQLCLLEQQETQKWKHYIAIVFYFLQLGVYISLRIFIYKFLIFLILFKIL